MLIHKDNTIKPQLPQTSAQARIAVLKQKEDRTKVAVKSERMRNRCSKFMPISHLRRPISNMTDKGLRSVENMRQKQAASIQIRRAPKISLHMYARAIFLNAAKICAQSFNALTQHHDFFDTCYTRHFYRAT
jgi:hypothetical protein